MVTLETAPAPGGVQGAGLIASLNVVTWLEEMPFGQMAFLLLARRGPARPGKSGTRIEDLRRLGAVLGLSGLGERLPLIGTPVSVTPTLTLLHFGPGWSSLRIDRTTSEWREHVTAGGPIAVMLGLDPVPFEPGAREINDYVDSCMKSNTALVGIAHGRRRAFPTTLPLGAF